MKQFISPSSHSGLTLVELLMVIAIIGVLASLMVPALGRAKSKSKMTLCLNNLRQSGVGFTLYGQDHDGRFPPSRVTNPRTEDSIDEGYGSETYFSIGGQDGTAKGLERMHLTPAALRPLNDYVKAAKTFRCSMDKGIVQFYCPTMEFSYTVEPSNWEVAGCSYQYNTGLIFADNLQPAGPGILKSVTEFIGDREFGWVPQPSKFILMHEPPAREWDGTLMHWHNAGIEQAKVTWQPGRFSRIRPLSLDPLPFISPVLFVDGHVAVHDFSGEIRANPEQSFEETSQWIWYKPRLETIEPGLSAE